MKRKIRLFGILLIITALIIMQLPVSEADAATSASDFRMEGTTLVKYRGTEESVSVPDTVEVIAEGAFEGNSYVELVVLPKSVKKIEPYAFWECENLETVVLNTGMTEVGDYAFANCKGLTRMSIPDNIRSIGIHAFMDCVNLTDINIVPEVTNIHETAFDGCYKLTIHCEKGSYADQYAESFYERQKEMPEYEDVDGYQSEDEDVQPTPTPVPEQDPEPGALLGDTRVVGNQAVVFIDNTSLEVMSGEVPDLELITEENSTEENAEEETKDNTNELPKYTIVDGKIVADQAYYKNRSLQEVSLPKGIEEIGQFAFARSTLQKIQVPEGVQTIGYGAFYHCDDLSQVVLPDTIENVEPKAFNYTAWVENFRANGAEDFLISGGVLVAYGGEESTVRIPDGVRVIGAEVFANHGEIEEVVLPDSLLTVGEAAFENCANMKVLVLGEQVAKIKDRAFAGCSFDNVSLPATVKEIGIGAFEQNVQITYGGAIPAVTYELSAQRLSNEAYRNPSDEQEAKEIKTVGLTGVSAQLEGATRAYTLSVKEADKTQMALAYDRCYSNALPSDCLIYDLQFTDNSGIPITKLGKQELEINIPLSENFATQKLLAYSLDRNGQLELAYAKRVRIDGTEYLRVELDYLSQIGIVGTGESDKNVIVLEESTTIESLSEAPGTEAKASTIKYQWIIAGVLIIAGFTCLLWKKHK